MSRMRFHPQRHGSRSVFNRGLSEFFVQHRKAERAKQKRQSTPEQEAAFAVIAEFVLIIVGFLVFGTIIAVVLSGGCSI